MKNISNLCKCTSSGNSVHDLRVFGAGFTCQSKCKSLSLSLYLSICIPFANCNGGDMNLRRFRCSRFGGMCGGAVEEEVGQRECDHKSPQVKRRAAASAQSISLRFRTQCIFASRGVCNLSVVRGRPYCWRCTPPIRIGGTNNGAACLPSNCAHRSSIKLNIGPTASDYTRAKIPTR